jgi:two-component system OmpR family sensor kinase
VTLAFAGAMALLLAALGLFIYLRFESNLDATLDQGLRARAAEIGGELGVSRRGSAALAQREESFAQILTPAGRVVDATPPLGAQSLLDRSALVRARSGPVFVERADVPGLEGAARLLAEPARAGRRSTVVVVGSSLDDRRDSLASLARILLIGGPVALLLASLAGYAATGAALRPVEAMRRRAGSISASAEPDERLPVPAAEDELRRLGETLNEMLDRLQGTLERERRFVNDASHELRTPLALHKTELELALRYRGSAEELRVAIASAVEETDRLIQLAEGLLVIARTEEGKLELDLNDVEVGDLIAGVGERFGARAREAGRRLALDSADGLRVRGDRLRLEQALTNLVDNALRHGEGDVRLWARDAGERVEVHVSDQGPGFPAEFLDRAFERFTQADAARSGAGAGLGLAIVDSISRSHGGRAVAVNRGGGADVWIELRSSEGRAGGSEV